MRFQTDALKSEPIYFSDILFHARYWKAGDVLDVGCNVGRTLPKEWYGIDSDRQAVEIANERGLSVVWGSAESLPFGEGRFDGVQCLQVLEHTTSPHKAVMEFSRVLRDGGRLVVSVPNIRWIGFRFWDYWTHVTPFTRSSLGQLLKEYGFDARVSYGHISLWGSKMLFRWGLLSIGGALKIQNIAYSLGLRDRRILVAEAFKCA